MHQSDGGGVGRRQVHQSDGGGGGEMTGAPVRWRWGWRDDRCTSQMGVGWGDDKCTSQMAATGSHDVVEAHAVIYIELE